MTRRRYEEGEEEESEKAVTRCPHRGKSFGNNAEMNYCVLITTRGLDSKGSSEVVGG